MAVNRGKIRSLIMRMTSDVPLDQIDDNLTPKKDLKKPKLPHSMILNQQTISQYWKILRENTDLTLTEQKIIADPATLDHIEAYGNNIENCIGTIKVPVGIAGPIRVNGLFAQGDYYLPLATTEAALVASYSRGARLISEAGGCSAAVINDGITRSPGFAFQNLADALKFVLWTNSQFDTFKKKSEATTKHGKLVDVRTTVEGNHVYLNFDFFTGDASGQNMVTIATAAILDYIRQNSPVKPKHIFIEANLSGDKKASALSFLSVRGKKVTAEVILQKSLVEKHLHTTPEILAEYWRMAALGGVMSGTFGVQAHYANGLAALYIATGQDVACVSESSVGITRLEVTPEGSLYASVTLPNIVVGTVGGGTKLPSQSIGLKLMGLSGEGKVLPFAEVCAACCLAGELSIMGAMCSGDFASAHESLARGKKGKK